MPKHQYFSFTVNVNFINYLLFITVLGTMSSLREKYTCFFSCFPRLTMLPLLVANPPCLLCLNPYRRNRKRRI